MFSSLTRLIFGDIAYKVSTDTDFETVFQNLQKQIKAHDFSIQEVHNIGETFQQSGKKIPHDFEYRLVQICNADKAYGALFHKSFDLGIMMPKNIVISRENGKTNLRFMQMKPWMVGMMFPGIGLPELSKKVMGTMKSIVHKTIAT